MNLPSLKNSPDTERISPAFKYLQELANQYQLPYIPAVLRDLFISGQQRLCPEDKVRIGIGMASCGIAAGADLRSDLLAAREDLSEVANLHHVGCIGACYAEPLIDVRTPDGNHYLFGKAGTNNHWPIIRTALKQSFQHGAWLVLKEQTPGLLTGFQDLKVERNIDSNLGTFFAHQQRRISRHCGLIDPSSLAEYVATGGYFSLAKTLATQKPRELIDLVAAARLRGRGGSGFATADKWRLAAASPDPTRYVIANADEGDPGAYMNRTLLESDPHQLLEGLMLSAYATGAQQAYIFVRNEYELSISHLQKAIDDAYDYGLLGQNILTTEFHLDVSIIRSGGAFVCGEETSLLQIMSNQRGEPIRRPPYPAEKGLNEHPTVINNVETLANIPWIVAQGSDSFQSLGTADSPGTKIFCLTGDVPKTGFIEVALGSSAQTIVEKIGGALPGQIKGLQIGGPSGGLIPYSDFPLDFSTLQTTGAMMGSGGLVVLNKHRCMIDLTRQLADFMAHESCGQCLLCRDGLQRLHDLLTDLISHQAHPDAMNEIINLAETIGATSRCGLGKTAVNPLLTVLRYFTSEFNDHLNGECPALSCKDLIRYTIVEKLCTDCLACYKYCPVQAVELLPISGPSRYVFNMDHCIHCKTCIDICPHSCIVPAPRREKAESDADNH